MEAESELTSKPSFIRQLAASLTMYTLSMSIGAGAGFSGVAIPQVIIHVTTLYFLNIILVIKYANLKIMTK